MPIHSPRCVPLAMHSTRTMLPAAQTRLAVAAKKWPLLFQLWDSVPTSRR